MTESTTTDQTSLAHGDGAGEGHESDRLLAIYLRDHLGAAYGGHALSKRLRDQNRDRWYGAELAAIEREIAGEIITLRSIMATLGVDESRVKQWAAMAAERVARLKANGRRVGYSPSSRVLELEALSAGVEGKSGLWRVLRAVADRRSDVSADELDRLHEQAVRQRERLEAIHANALQEAFLGARPAPPSSAPRVRRSPGSRHGTGRRRQRRTAARVAPTSPVEDIGLARAVVELLGERAIATAESCTAGRVAETLAAVEGASGFLRGGLVAYQDEVKQRLLGVTAESVLTPEAAGQMAQGAATLFAAAVTVATTGVAGDAPIEGTPPGTVYIATFVDGDVVVREHHFEGAPEAVCDQARRASLSDLLQALRRCRAGPRRVTGGH